MFRIEATIVELEVDLAESENRSLKISGGCVDGRIETNRGIALGIRGS